MITLKRKSHPFVWVKHHLLATVATLHLSSVREHFLRFQNGLQATNSPDAFGELLERRKERLNISAVTHAEGAFVRAAMSASGHRHPARPPHLPLTCHLQSVGLVDISA